MPSMILDIYIGKSDKTIEYKNIAYDIQSFRDEFFRLNII